MIFSIQNRLKILVFIGAGVLVIAGFFTEGPQVAGITVGRLGIVSTVLIGIIVAFDRWIWRIPLVVKWLRTGPVLRGTWKGELVSTYDDRRRPVYVAIRQRFTEIEVRMMTKESTSETSSSQLLRKPEDLSVLEYSYSNVPRATVRHRSEVHFGSARLECTGQVPTRIEGSYWTDRRTTGEMVFESRKSQIVQSYAEADELDWV
ncbi:MAG: hypothetical protein U5R31_13280 [Acidimicrobiia bacterium]|nr:hypothetical protein [Acidimicrobiia bacterium]